jgi:C-terminal processing protease CtpA/Prc
MIYGPYTNMLFLKSQYNDMLQEYIRQQFGEDYLNIYFESEITDEKNVKTPIVSLNLPDLYVITTDNTASASESVINGLQPYINVTIVGTATHGKYVGSMTIKDYIDNKGTVNPNHKWAMQPIVVKIANSKGVSDYVNGLPAQVQLKEDIANLSVLGSLDEPLLSRTITAITGTTLKKALAPSGIQLMDIPQIQDFTRKTEMYIEPKFPLGKLN